MNKEIKVLFIGNSYTFFNEMNKIFENICASSDKFVITTLITRGGARLDGYSNHNTQSGMKVQEELKNGYDYVFLQEQSNLPVVLRDKFFNSVRSLVSDIRNYGSTPILYETWAKKAGHEALKKYNLSVHDMEDGLFSAYEDIGKELDVKVSMVGRCFKYCVDNELFDCYNKDLSHPSEVGSFIIAMCHYYTIYGTLDDVNYLYKYDKKDLEEIKTIIKNSCVER